MKKIIICMLTVLLAFAGSTLALAASNDDGGFSAGAEAAESTRTGAAYSVVSAVVNREYDFKEDFHDSYPYDEDFCTEGIFNLDDYNGDVTLTLENNSTSERFVFERNADTEWSVKASVDHLLYETAQIGAAVHIYDLGGDYGIRDTDIPVTITVKSSQYSADFHKYPSYNAYTVMHEDKDFTVDYDASSSDRKAAIRVLKIPHLFELEVYNTETKQIEYYDDENAEFVFQENVEVPDYDPARASFWFYVPCKLPMNDGYEFEFTLSVYAFHNKSSGGTEATTAAPTEEESTAASGTEQDRPSAPATGDSASSTSDSGKAFSQTPDSSSGGAVQTGEPVRAFVAAAMLLIMAAVIGLYAKKTSNR